MKTGHQREGCFEIIGYPDCYKPLQDQKKNNQVTPNRSAVAMNTENDRTNNSVDERTMSNLIRSEFHKLFEKLKSQGSGNIHADRKCDSWIVDSGVTTHMCNNHALFDLAKPHTQNTYIHLADGSKHLIMHSGNMRLTDKLLLENTLHVPNLKFNLLSDHRTREVIGIACLVENLYIIKTESFDKRFIEDVLADFRYTVFIVAKIEPDTWHKRLGHLSHDVLINTGLIDKTTNKTSTCEIPTAVLKWKTPYEILMKKAVDYSFFRTFGCLCFATNTLPHKSKFDNRAIKCIFLGYANNQKGYRVYDIDKKIIFTYRDVVFKENIFPFANECTDPINSDIQTYNQSVTSIIEDQDEQDIHTQSNPEIIDEHTNAVDQQEHEHTSDDMHLRRSRRQIIRPAKLQDYVCVCDKENRDIYTVKFQDNMNTCMSVVFNLPTEPKNYTEAMKVKEWLEAMKSEIKALKDNDT
ncbi:uncharacterized protein LOC110012144 [Sesamum indicum]|uniref:Uncharacterized protein LOC110012144 n=1 Tax=Sesamum indicum TaxID=4182 RepID=A0A8M8V2N6_SESIN|nr:uncharacterized protein LOC110012144 [Sesamum indicum]